jgi:hypothetical protein
MTNKRVIMTFDSATAKERLAQAIDNSSSIGIYHGTAHYPRMEIKTLDRETFEIMRATELGTAYDPAEPGIPYKWLVQGQNAVDLADFVYDYVFAKKEHLRIIKEFGETLTNAGRGRKLDPQVIEYRQSLANEISALNGRGPKRKSLEDIFD